MYTCVVRPSTQTDIPWMTEIFRNYWEGDYIVSRGKKHGVKDLSGCIALIQDKKVGLLTYQEDGESFELVSLNSVEEGKGVGTALINALITHAKEMKKQRIWLVTTNNNQSAMRFYEHRGFHKVREYKNAVAESRKIKPSIPLVDESGVPIQDEIEYAYVLTDNAAE